MQTVVVKNTKGVHVRGKYVIPLDVNVSHLAFSKIQNVIGTCHDVIIKDNISTLKILYLK